MPARAVALTCFFLSGATGLLYEVVWIRLFGAVIGNTHFSITLVVSVFMGGLALGSFVGGRLADRSPNPLRLYGILTLLVGLSCVLVPVLVEAARPLFYWLYAYHDGEPEAPVLLAVRIAVCTLILLVPTSFMGATLPALSRHFARRYEKVGGTVGGLYALNTLGAVAGAAFTGFAAIPLLGVWGCIALAVVVDFAIAAAVFVASREEAVEVAASPATEKASGSPRRGSARQGQEGPAPAPEAAPSMLSGKVRLPVDVRLAVVAFGVVGFADMLLQIAWTKAIVLSIGNSTYAFSLIVSLFILGIAVGGAAISLLVDRWKNLLLSLGICVFITAALVSATVPFLGFLPIIAARAFDRIQPPSYGKFLLAQILLVSATILPSTILMGTVFPIVGKMRTRAIDRVGSAIGSAYFWNTMGSILGTLAAGFLFIPLFGRVHATLYLGVGLSLVTGVVLIFKALHTSLPVRLAVVASLVAVVAIPAFLARPHGVLGSTGSLWHPSIMSRGAYVYYTNAYRAPDGTVIPVDQLVDGIIKSNEVIFFEEGIHAPVAVVKNPQGVVAMRISGKVEASMSPGGGTNYDMPHQILAGHLPMILHRAPSEVLTLGLGGGVTLGTLTLYPVQSIDSLEIAPEVIDAAREYFGSANRKALENPIVRNVVGDGRNHLEYTRRRYDVITSVPSNPWIAGIGNLFTVEFFEACRDRLKEGGIICNWIHKINMRAEDFRTVVRTFADVFSEHAQLWDLGYDALLIGSNSPIRFDAARLERLLRDSPGIVEDLRIVGITGPESFLRQFLFGTEDLRRYAGSSGPRNRDADPVLEFSCPYGLYGHQYDAFESLALAQRTELSPGWIEGLSAPLERASRARAAFQAVQRADARWHAGGPGSEESALRELLEAEKLLVDAPDPWVDQRAGALAARLLGPQGLAGMGAPADLGLRALFCASSLKKAREAATPEAKAAQLEAAGARLDALPAASREFVLRWMEMSQASRAIPFLEAALARVPESAPILHSLGVAQAAAGRTDVALATLAAAAARAADAATRSEILQDRAYSLQLAGRLDEAAAEYEKALQENPGNEVARTRLGQLQERRQP